MGDWLGSGRVANGKENFLPFGRRETTRGAYDLKSQTEWKAYCKSGEKPTNIPAHPDHVYAGTGWVDWGDWLGTGVTATRARQYRRFNEARAFVHSLGLETRSDWRSYCGSGNKPPDIPARPDHVYAETGWAGWNDWLGIENVSSRQRLEESVPAELQIEIPD